MFHFYTPENVIWSLTLPISILDEEKKINIFIFTLLCDALKGFMIALS